MKIRRQGELFRTTGLVPIIIESKRLLKQKKEEKFADSVVRNAEFSGRTIFCAKSDRREYRVRLARQQYPP